MDEKTALAILFAYKKRKRYDQKDYLAMSDAVNYLKTRKAASLAKVAKMTGFGTETLRNLAMLRELPTEVQNLIRDHKLGYEAHKIMSIKDGAKRVEAGQAMVGLNTKDMRALIEYVNNTGLPIDISKKRLLESKTEKKKVYMVVLELLEDSYIRLKNEATKNKLSVDEFATRIINKRMGVKQDVGG